MITVPFEKSREQPQLHSSPSSFDILNLAGRISNLLETGPAAMQIVCIYAYYMNNSKIMPYPQLHFLPQLGLVIGNPDEISDPFFTLLSLTNLLQTIVSIIGVPFSII